MQHSKIIKKKVSRAFFETLISKAIDRKMKAFLLYYTRGRAVEKKPFGSLLSLKMIQ
jgi:hypothetical protein